MGVPKLLIHDHGPTRPSVEIQIHTPAVDACVVVKQASTAADGSSAAKQDMPASKLPSYNGKVEQFAKVLAALLACAGVTVLRALAHVVYCTTLSKPRGQRVQCAFEELASPK